MLLNIPAEIRSSPDFGEWLKAFRALTETIKAPVHTAPVYRPSSVKWDTIPTFPGRSDLVDTWFVKFETAMNAYRMSKADYSPRLLECPSLDACYKARISECMSNEYDDTRGHMLKIYGPSEPLGFYRRQIFMVKGDTRDKVMASLLELLTLHNRAAAAESRELWREKDLLHAFAETFPAATAASLVLLVISL